MSSNPRRFRRPWRLIVTLESADVARVDELLATDPRHRRHRNRSEFVRRAVEAEIERCR
jgi:metal-responsive CopG/Arc/MetJ family transcriptional regulator